MGYESNSRWIVGVTGASGICYARRLIAALIDLNIEQHLIFSESALRVLKDEEGISVSQSNLLEQLIPGKSYANVTLYNPKDVGALIASGSAQMDGMVVVPCSMNSLGAIAHGVHSHLIHRAADVTIKEGRRLVLVPRETPLSQIHLENMLKLSRMGIAIVPAMPGYYTNPNTIEDLVDSMVMKILDAMRIPNSVAKRWKEGRSEDDRIVTGPVRIK